MIKVYSDKQVVITFGKGDICVNGGDSSQSEVGIVLLNNQSPRDIGSVGKLLKGQEYEHKDMDVVIEFTKVESIDVLIRALEEAKKCMD
jgi:hypothetical protein